MFRYFFLVFLILPVPNYLSCRFLLFLAYSFIPISNSLSFSLCLCLCICLSVSLFYSLSISLSVSLCVSLSLSLSLSLSDQLEASLSLCLCICLSVCLSLSLFYSLSLSLSDYYEAIFFSRDTLHATHLLYNYKIYCVACLSIIVFRLVLLSLVFYFLIFWRPYCVLVSMTVSEFSLRNMWVLSKK